MVILRTNGELNSFNRRQNAQGVNRNNFVLGAQGQAEAPESAFPDSSIPTEKIDYSFPAQYDATVTKEHVSEGTLIQYDGVNFYRIIDVIQYAQEKNKPSLSLFIQNGVYEELGGIGSYSVPLSIEVTLVGETREGVVIEVASQGGTDPAWNFSGSINFNNLTFTKSDNPKAILSVQGNANLFFDCIFDQTEINPTTGESQIMIIKGSNTATQNCIFNQAIANSFSGTSIPVLPGIMIEDSADNTSFLQNTFNYSGTMIACEENSTGIVIQNNNFVSTSTKAVGFYAPRNIFYTQIFGNAFTGTDFPNTCEGVHLEFTTNEIKYMYVDSNSFTNLNYGIYNIGAGIRYAFNNFNTNIYHIWRDSVGDAIPTSCIINGNIAFEGTVFLGRGGVVVTDNCFSQLDSNSTVTTLGFNAVGNCANAIIANNRIIYGKLQLSPTSSNVILRSNVISVDNDSFIVPVNAFSLIIDGNISTLSGGGSPVFYSGAWRYCIITNNNITQIVFPSLYGCTVEGNELGSFYAERVGGLDSGVLFQSTVRNNVIINDFLVTDSCHGEIANNTVLFGGMVLGNCNQLNLIGNKVPANGILADFLSDCVVDGNYVYSETIAALDVVGGIDGSKIVNNHLEGDNDSPGGLKFDSAVNGGFVSNNYIQCDNDTTIGAPIIIDGQIGNGGSFDFNSFTISNNIIRDLGDGHGIEVGSMFNAIITGNFIRVRNTARFPIRCFGVAEQCIMTNNRLKRGTLTTGISIGTSTNNFIGTQGAGQPNLMG